ncbi:hypothetical protein AA0481_0930 [Acetobacter orientalis NRIC 0481]|nr:hypothetical protein AA0481_0930 [Acetobacter orientalis NRIC 0481]
MLAPKAKAAIKRAHQQGFKQCSVSIAVHNTRHGRERVIPYRVGAFFWGYLKLSRGGYNLYGYGVVGVFYQV